MTEVLHKHHRVPKHQGGTDDPSNIVEVSISQHAELHFALYLEHGRQEDWDAAFGLLGLIPKQELAHRAQVRAGHKTKRDKAYRKAVSKACKGKKKSAQGRENIRKAAQGRPPMSDEEKRKRSEGMKRAYREGRHDITIPSSNGRQRNNKGQFI